ncbi:MAG: DUF4177 domain-containing protein [bacterium]|nr:DUF4177 domain-containing protein [bacterium]MDT8365079.1 DUF4177 domain-containing protein [bacterium]
MNLKYKVVETQIVTDEVMEGLINSWVDKGWHLDGIRFAMSDASKRPSMAFILFTREGDTLEEENGGGDGEGS